MSMQGFRGNCDSQGKLGMCPSLAEPDSSGIPRRTSFRKTNLQRPAKGGSTPAFACQRAAIAPLPCPNLQLVSQKESNCELVSFKKCNCSRKNKLQVQFAPQMWATRPHLGSIFKKLLHQKTFICLRLGNCSQSQKIAYFYLLFHVKHYTISSDFYLEV